MKFALNRFARRAFTLIELLVVIAIIAVLIGFTIPLIRKVQIAGRGASTQAQITTIANAIQQYYADFHAYPGPLPNSQLGTTYTTGVVPFVIGQDGGNRNLNGLPNRGQDSRITGPENLVLGLLGGLELTSNNGTPPDVGAFLYNPLIIFPDGVTPNPVGAMSLNFNKPKRTPAYLQVRSGDISHPSAMVNNGQFTDTANRAANDTLIPEFVDQYGDQMPILYLRANVGGTAIAGIGTTPAGSNDDNGNPLLQDPGNPGPVTAQYDIAQILAYTRALDDKGIFTVARDTKHNHHGLQYVGLFTPTQPMVPKDDITNGWSSTTPGHGANACAYFKDPNNPGTSNTPNSTANPVTKGNARQKDGYILISAGPDRIYGTDDDIIYPGSLQP